MLARGLWGQHWPLDQSETPTDPPDGPALARPYTLNPTRGPTTGPMSFKDYAQRTPDPGTSTIRKVYDRLMQPGTPSDIQATADLDPAMHGETQPKGKTTLGDLALIGGAGALTAAPILGAAFVPMGLSQVAMGAREMGGSGGREGKAETAMGVVNTALGMPEAAVGLGKLRAGIEAMSPGEAGSMVNPFFGGKSLPEPAGETSLADLQKQVDDVMTKSRGVTHPREPLDPAAKVVASISPSAELEGAPNVITRDTWKPTSRGVFDRGVPDIQGTRESDPRLRPPSETAFKGKMGKLVEAMLNSKTIPKALDREIEVGRDLGGPEWYNLAPIEASLAETPDAMSFAEFNATGAGSSIRNTVPNELAAQSVINWARKRGVPLSEAKAEYARLFGKRPQIMDLHFNTASRGAEEGAALPFDPNSEGWKVPSHGDKRMGGGASMDVNEPGGMPALDAMERNMLMGAIRDNPRLAKLAREQNAFADYHGGVLPIGSVRDYQGASQLYSDATKRADLPTVGATQASRWLGGKFLRPDAGTVARGDFTQITEDQLLHTAKALGKDTSPAGLRKLWGAVAKRDAMIKAGNPSERGAALPEVTVALGRAGLGGAAGGAAGAQQGDTPKARKRNALIGAGLGAVGGVALPSMLAEGEAGAAINPYFALPGKWYSRLSEAIEAGPESASAEQWVAHLNKAEGGIAKNEREWSGIDDLFADRAPNEQMSKDHLLKLAEDQGVALKETVFGGGEDQAKVYQLARERTIGANRDLEHALRGIEDDRLLTENQRRRELQGILEKIDYAVPDLKRPGGRPLEERIDHEAGWIANAFKWPELREPIAEAMAAALREDDALHASEAIKRGKYTGSQYVSPGLSNKREIVMQLAPASYPHDGGDPYTGGHFSSEAPNDVSHIRIGDAKYGDEKVLLIDETQSDRAQAARDMVTTRELDESGTTLVPTNEPKGWATPEKRAAAEKKIEETTEAYRAVTREHKAASAAADAAYAALSDEEKIRLWSRKPGDPAYAEYEATQHRLNEAGRAWERAGAAMRDAKEFDRDGRGGIPNSPYKTTEEWNELNLKRAIQDAVERGMDRVAWTTGQTQADRYNLRQHVERIEYEPKAKRLTAFSKSGDAVIDESPIEPEKLPDYIGKDVARRLLESSPTDSRFGTGFPRHRIEGASIEVGGEGHIDLYGDARGRPSQNMMGSARDEHFKSILAREEKSKAQYALDAEKRAKRGLAPLEYKPPEMRPFKEPTAIFPKLADKYTRSIGGEGLEPIDLFQPEPTVTDLDAFEAETKGVRYIANDKRKALIRNWIDEVEGGGLKMDQWMDSEGIDDWSENVPEVKLYNQFKEFLARRIQGSDRGKVMSFKITPAMREHVLKKGQRILGLGGLLASAGMTGKHDDK